MKPTLLLFFLCSAFLSAEPTESREWQTTGGFKTQARALSATATSVTLELATGKKVVLPLEKLVPADREAVLAHFKIEPPKEGDPVRSGAEPLTGEGLDYQIGKITPNVEAAADSHFHIYLPTTLKKGRPAPLIHFNDAAPVSPGSMQPYIAACERFGWILVGSVESRNNTEKGDRNLGIARSNINMLRENPLVDPERIYFTGGSGGGASSWKNCANLKGAGTMPNIAYIPLETKITTGHHFVTGGATDYNRYHSAISASGFGKDAIYRPFPGGHSAPKEPWIRVEGIAWLTAKYLAKNAKNSALAGDRLDFEAAVIDWMADLTPTQSNLAYHIGKMMQDVYGITGKNDEIISAKVTELGKVSANVKFSEGLQAIHDLGVKSMAREGLSSVYNHNVPAISRKATALAEEYAGIEFVEETFKGLSEPTVGK